MSHCGMRFVMIEILAKNSDGKRGQNLEAKARAMRPRPELWCWGRGQFLEHEANAEAKNNYEKVPNNDKQHTIRDYCQKIHKIRKFYAIFAGKMPDYIIRQRDWGQAEAKCLRPRPKLRGRGRMFEAEAKILASRPLWPRGLIITGGYCTILNK